MGTGSDVAMEKLPIAEAAHEGNAYESPVGWGITGTHIRPSAAPSGIGSLLFTATLAASRNARLSAIEAYIGEQNKAALAYYEAMGFRTCRCPDGIICKVLTVPSDPSVSTPKLEGI